LVWNWKVSWLPAELVWNWKVSEISDVPNPFLALTRTYIDR
jgi:hypothetical protein